MRTADLKKNLRCPLLSTVYFVVCLLKFKQAVHWFCSRKFFFLFSTDRLGAAVKRTIAPIKKKSIMLITGIDLTISIIRLSKAGLHNKRPAKPFIAVLEMTSCDIKHNLLSNSCLWYCGVIADAIVYMYVKLESTVCAFFDQHFYFSLFDSK